ncbi:hypothetical protein BGZ95_002340 [Linnemannia exigua]|uniref:Uncharacterized protein n=1 Tax=Linnemannia exigua TaxID=604196 RepID=A0AAD4H4C6_9FUNG|nr:hypothetical protein BGZ95_002340 [Linnemannia exigua]
MFKTLLPVLVLAQSCILAVNASHYISYALRGGGIIQHAGICLHDHTGLLMRDHDAFGSGVQNYGFHKNGWSLNVNWRNRDVSLQGHGTFGFQGFAKDWDNHHWDGCWDTPGAPPCSDFKAKAYQECASYFKSVVWKN